MGRITDTKGHNGYLFWLLFCCVTFGLIYYLFPCRRYWGDDLYYALATESGDIKNTWISNPRHVLYGYLGFAVVYIFSSCAPHLRAVYLLQGMNTLFGIAGIFVFGLTVYHVGKNRFVSLILAASLASSYGYWNYAVRAESYALNNLVLILVAYFLSKTDKGIANSRNSLALGLALSCAILTTVVNVLIVGTVVLSMLSAGYFRSSRKDSAILVSAIILPVIAAYLVIARAILKLGTVRGIIQWLFCGKQSRYFSFGADLPVKFLYGQFRTVIGGGFLNRWAVHGPDAAVLLCTLLSFLMVLFGLYLSYRMIKAGFWSILGRSGIAKIFMLWLAAMSAFHFFWSTGDYKVLISNLIPLYLLSAVILCHGDGRRIAAPFRKIVLVGIPVSLCAVNFFGDVLPQSNPRLNDDANYTRFIIEHSAPDDLVLISGSGESSVALQAEYFYGRHFLGLVVALRDPRGLADTIDVTLDNARGVYLTSDMKSISSNTFFKNIEQYKPEYAAEGGKVKALLETFGFILKPSVRYNGKDRFQGQILYTIERKDESTAQNNQGHRAPPPP